MRKNFGPQSWLYPMPVLIIGTYDENGIPDAMNAAWGSIHNTNQIGICLDVSHKTVENILKRKAFTVSIADAANTAAADYVGIVSANDVPDKISRSGLHTRKSELVDAPVIEEFPLTLECRFVSYDEESEQMVGDILNVSADESILGEDGKISLSKFKPIIFDPVRLEYLTLGEKAGNAFQDGEKLRSEQS